MPEQESQFTPNYYLPQVQPFSWSFMSTANVIPAPDQLPCNRSDPLRGRDLSQHEGDSRVG